MNREEVIRLLTLDLNGYKGMLEATKYLENVKHFKDKIEALEYAIKEIERTAQEVPVQEQYVIRVSFDKTMLKDKLIRIDNLKNELEKEINSLPLTIKSTYQNSLKSY